MELRNELISIIYLFYLYCVLQNLMPYGQRSKKSLYDFLTMNFQFIFKWQQTFLVSYPKEALEQYIEIFYRIFRSALFRVILIRNIKLSATGGASG